MKQINIAILFIIIIIVSYTIMDLKTLELSALTNKKIDYNKAFDAAVDDGLRGLVEMDSNGQLNINKEDAVEGFFQSLYVNFAVVGNSLKERELRGYVPLILIVDWDGFYVYYSETSTVNHEKVINPIYTSKMPFSYQDSKYIYEFTLGNYLSVLSKENGKIYRGNKVDLLEDHELLQDSLLGDSKFDEIKRISTIQCIEEKMNFYIGEYNKIGQEFGLDYYFWLPTIDEGDWTRTIKDIGMMVIMQGYPFGIKEGEVFNRYTISGARIKKVKPLFIEEYQGEKTYHRQECKLLRKKEILYYTRKECALEGAYPCPICRP